MNIYDRPTVYFILPLKCGAFQFSVRIDPLYTSSILFGLVAESIHGARSVLAPRGLGMQVLIRQLQ